MAYLEWKKEEVMRESISYCHANIHQEKIKKLALNSGIQTYQIVTNDDKVCTPSLSSILLPLNLDDF